MSKASQSKSVATVGRLGFVAVIAGAVLATAQPAAARPRASLLPAEPEPVAQLFAAQRGDGISLAQATAMAQRQVQGRVVKAETVRVGDRVVHEIRILVDDRVVRTVRIDAQTGSFL